MIKKDLIKIFVDEVYSKSPKKYYPTDQIIYNHIDEIWSIDLADMIDYKKSKKNKRYRYIFIIFDTFSKNIWYVLLNKSSKTVTDAFSCILSTSK